MKERPILFNGAMVRAMLDGSKTQTRRLVKDLPSWEITEIVSSASGCGRWLPNGPAPSGRGMASGHWRPCPYGRPGDRLWVRETHSIRVRPEDATDGMGIAWYAADRIGHDIRWRPSIHMPRWASRILLEIGSVRVERLQDISEADARAEGVESLRGEGVYWRDYTDPRGKDAVCLTCTNARDSYFTLWESINGAGSWDANPWVWRVEFERVTP